MTSFFEFPRELSGVSAREGSTISYSPLLLSGGTRGRASAGVKKLMFGSFSFPVGVGSVPEGVIFDLLRVKF